jgi:integrase
MQQSSAVPKRNASSSDRLSLPTKIALGVKKPASSVQGMEESTFYSECSSLNTDNHKQSGRSPYLHIHSPGVVCPACQALELEAMEDSFAELTFAEALPLWLFNHAPSIHPNTLHYYKQYGNALKPFFGPMKLKDIGIGALRGFQRWRSHVYTDNDTLELPLHSELLTSKFRHGAGSVRIKNEINCVLKPMLREAGQWAGIEAKKFKHLPVPREGSGVPLDKGEQAEFMAIAFSRKKWMLAAHCLRIEYRTGTGFGELRKLRRKHVDLKAAKMQIIEGAKNSGIRVRTVPLVPSALESMEWIMNRSKAKSGDDPESYILPHRTKGFTVPMGSIHRAFIAIKAEWAKRHPGTAKILTRQCDARTSTACLLLKNPNLSLPTIHKTLGWMPSSRMRDRYNRVDHDAKMEVLRTLEDEP